LYSFPVFFLPLSCVFRTPLPVILCPLVCHFTPSFCCLKSSGESKNCPFKMSVQSNTS
jgi:hypothetical protein